MGMINPVTVKVGDKVTPNLRIRNVLPDRLRPDTVYTVVAVRPRPTGGALVGVEGIANGEPNFGHEWFDEVEQTGPSQVEVEAAIHSIQAIKSDTPLHERGPSHDPPEYETFNFEDISKALRDIARQHVAGEPLTWTGPDRLHHSISACTPEPSWNFSPEGLEYHAEQDRDFWDVFVMIAFQLGFHNGYLRADNDNAVYRKDFKRYFK